MIVLFYCIGLIFISVGYVIKLNRLLRIAGRSIEEEEPFREKCPEELTEFGMKLKEFKYKLASNEQARLAAEQQGTDGTAGDCAGACDSCGCGQAGTGV